MQRRLNPQVVAYTSFANPSRLLKEKTLLSLMRGVSKRPNRQINLVIVNPVSERAENRKVEQSCVAYWLPFLPGERFLKLIASSDLYIERCIDEELGLCSIDAGMVGTPVAKLTYPLFVEVRKTLGETPTFIYVGGESFIGGFHVLLRSLPSLVRLGARVRLFGNYRGFQVKNHYVELIGKVPHGIVMRAHEDAWGLLFPSINEESLPYAVVEAALAGTVPIATRTGGVPEILGGTKAERFMFRAGNVEDLVSKIKELIDLGVDCIRKIGAEAKGIVHRRLKESARRLPKVFIDVLSGG